LTGYFPLLGSAYPRERTAWFFLDQTYPAVAEYARFITKQAPQTPLSALTPCGSHNPKRYQNQGNFDPPESERLVIIKFRGIFRCTFPAFWLSKFVVLAPFPNIPKFWWLKEKKGLMQEQSLIMSILKP
jgi:hypothetical protein